MSRDQGDLGELEFTLQAKKRGYNVSKPYSAITVYDLILDNGYNLFKIQIKTTKNTYRSGYKAVVSRGSSHKKIYSIVDVDYFAIYIIPKEIFYIMPAHVIQVTTLNLYPDKPDHYLDKYREAWHLLK
jgi:hypothetical protein